VANELAADTDLIGRWRSVMRDHVADDLLIQGLSLTVASKFVASVCPVVDAAGNIASITISCAS
jgi:hypothetical protein